MRKTYVRWTQIERDYLKENYGKVPIQELVYNLNHTKIAICREAVNNLKLHSVIGLHVWTPKEIVYLKKYYGKITAKNISLILERSEKEIVRKAIKLHLKSNLIGFIDKKHSQKTKRIMALRRRNWYKENPEKSVQKARKLSLTLKGKNYEERYGLKKSNKIKKIMSLKRKGRKNGMYNKPHSEITKNLQSKLSKIRYKERPEIKRKISSSLKKLWANPRYAKRQYKLLQLKPTLPEKQITQIVNLNNLSFKYVGDGKEIINRFNPDFISKKFKLIIEFNGECWHKDKNRERRKKRIYNLLGYRVLVIWNKELRNNPQNVTKKIMEFYAK